MARRWVAICAIGLAAGFLSGFFGVGGGSLIVPMLVLVLGFDQRRAAATSLLAILPTSLVGAFAYALHGEIDGYLAAPIVAGAVVGALLGSWLLRRLPLLVLRWLFIAFLVLVIIQLFIVTPHRDGAVSIAPGDVVMLGVTGLVTGLLSSVIGVGGGVVVVPSLTVFFGVGDLIAKATSLLVIVPTTLTSSIANYRSRLLDVRVGFLIGLAAVPTTFLGVAAATAVSPQVGNILLALYLSAIALQMSVKVVRETRSHSRVDSEADGRVGAATGTGDLVG